MTDPTALIGAGGVVARGGVATAEALGITGVLARTLGVGVEAGAVNAAMDAAGQGLDMASGLQKDGFSKTQAAGAFAIGAGLGGGMHVVAEAIGRRIAARKAAEDAALPPGETIPIALPDVALGEGGRRPAPSIPEDAPLQRSGPSEGDVGREAAPATRASVLAEQAAEAPALRSDPVDDAAGRHAARRVEAIPDQEFGKIAEAVEMAQPLGDGRIQAPLSVEEGALLKGQGIDVDEAGGMPASVADAVLREKVRREHVASVGQAAPAPEASPQARPGLALVRQNFDPAAPPKEPGQLDRRAYVIERDGERVGSVIMKVDGDVAEIRDIYGEIQARPISGTCSARRRSRRSCASSWPRTHRSGA